MQHSVCPVTACIIADYDTLCVIMFILLHHYNILLHNLYLLLFCLLLHVITMSNIVYYYIVITYCYYISFHLPVSLLHHYYPVIHYVNISHYYLFLTGELVDD